jgi:hypothetical protein
VGDVWKVMQKLTPNIGTRCGIWPAVNEGEGLVLMPGVTGGNNAIATLQSNAAVDCAGNAAGLPYYRATRKTLFTDGTDLSPDTIRGNR